MTHTNNYGIIHIELRKEDDSMKKFAKAFKTHITSMHMFGFIMLMMTAFAVGSLIGGSVTFAFVLPYMLINGIGCHVLLSFVYSLTGVKAFSKLSKSKTGDGLNA